MLLFPFGKRIKRGDRGEPLPEPNEGLPDSYRPAGICPRCGKQSSFEVVGSLPVTFGDSCMVGPVGITEKESLDRVSSLICRHCNQGTIVVEEQWVGDTPVREQRTGGVVTYRGVHWWPLPQSSVSPDVPAQVGQALAEATMALAANCPRASAVMARRTLEAITVEQGETTGTLAERLGNLADRSVLHPTLAEWAKEIRLIGNVGAHFDPIDTVTRDDAQKLLSFVQELLRHLYELPAELNRKRVGPRP